MIDAIWKYVADNAATLITTYLGILLTFYMRRKGKEQSAVNAYLSNLGTYIEAFGVPPQDYLSQMKEEFAKYYEVKKECFPIKRAALVELLFLYRSHPNISFNRQYRLYQILQGLKLRFIEHDSLKEKKSGNIPYWKQIVKEYVISFAFLMIVPILQIMSYQGKINPKEILILVSIYAFCEFLAFIFVEILFLIWHWAKRGKYKHYRDEYFLNL